MDSLYIGVDVGSGSVRAGLFDSRGELKHVAVQEIRINNPEPGYYEQSSQEIWNAVAFTVKEVTKNVDDKDQISGISFCATCSLVAIGEANEPVSLNKDLETSDWNIIMWMDHRASLEAEFINQTNHQVLQYVGGQISLEMETPKLLWLQNNMRERFDSTRHFFDLADFLRWQATGSLRRSVCCVACKWTFVNSPINSSWDEDYFQKIGLSDVLPKIGSTVSFPGDSDQISLEAAETLGLSRRTKVGFSMIDAHSGVLGMLGCHSDENGHEQVDPSKRLGIICGTSNCHMALSRESLMVPGIWGPYFGVILQQFYLNEGGQSAAGKLLDHVVMSHLAYPLVLQETGSHGKVLSKLEQILKSISPDRSQLSQLTSDLHIWPDFHGNRSPLADPTLKGMISGLTLSNSVEDLAVLYLATIQALAYGSRHIKEMMEKSGHKFKELVICGGLTKSKLFLQMHADIIGLPVVIPDCTEPVLLGAAMSAALASAPGFNLSHMAGGCSTIQPQLENQAYHDKKYKVFLRLVDDQKTYRNIMAA